MNQRDNRSERDRERGCLNERDYREARGYQPSDEALREEICARLMHADDIDSSAVTVTVVAGKVTLEGTVPDLYTKHAIEALADAGPGVQDIENRVRVRSREEATSADERPAPLRR